MTRASTGRRQFDIEDLIKIIGDHNDFVGLPITYASPLLVDVADADEHWFVAMDKVEKRNDGADLRRLVVSCDMSPAVRLALADLFLRKFKPKPGKRATPIYDLPEKAKSLFIAARAYKDLQRHSNFERSRALAEAANMFGLSEHSLEDHIAGKLGSTQIAVRKRQAFLAALAVPAGQR